MLIGGIKQRLRCFDTVVFLIRSHGPLMRNVRLLSEFRNRISGLGR